MADDKRIEPLALDALTALIDQNIGVSNTGRTAPDAPRNPMAAAANYLASCAVRATNEEIEGFSKIDPKIIALKDQKNLEACIEDFARNVRLASNEASNNVPNNADKGGRSRD